MPMSLNCSFAVHIRGIRQKSKLRISRLPAGPCFTKIPAFHHDSFSWSTSLELFTPLNYHGFYPSLMEAETSFDIQCSRVSGYFDVGGIIETFFSIIFQSHLLNSNPFLNTLFLKWAYWVFIFTIFRGLYHSRVSKYVDDLTLRYLEILWQDTPFPLTYVVGIQVSFPLYPRAFQKSINTSSLTFLTFNSGEMFHVLRNIGMLIWSS